MEAKGIDQNAENIKTIKSIFGDEVSEDYIGFALTECNNNVDAAINEILDKPASYSPQFVVRKKVTSTGARVSAQIKPENVEEAGEIKALLVSKSEEKGNGNPEMGSEGKVSVRENVAKKMSFDDFLRANNIKVEADEEYLSFQIREQREKDSKAIVKVKEEPDVGPTSLQSSKLVVLPDMTFEEYPRLTEEKDKPNDEKMNPQIKEERPEEKSLVVFDDKILVKEEMKEPIMVQPLSSRPPSVQNGSMYDRLKPSNVKKQNVEDNRMLSTVVIEDGDFPQEPDWLLVGRTAITGLSTTKGRKLENNEIVHLAFPSGDSISKYRSPFVSTKTAAAVSGIVRFSTTRSGEIGRLSMEWAKCLVPLVNSAKVKVLSRCIAASTNLHLMQDVLLYASFYIHKSVITDGDKSSWRLDSPSYIDSTVYPILTLFRLLKTKPYQEAAFTPEELHSRKRVLNLEGDSAVLPVQKRGKGCQPDQNNDEQAITESALNELVGAAAVYNLEEREPPCTLMCDLRPYQKQALYWMSESEKGVDVEKAAKMLHPCWAAYRICDERVSTIYVNIFSGEATTKFPTATQMARGGILADAMGLGKTVMTISLILARSSKGNPDSIRKRESGGQVSQKVRGGTLIICPMALLGQWKDELNTHSRPGSISVFVHYGGDRSNNPKIIAEADVVLTTYGVLSAAYKNGADNSIFHAVDWYRVVLDEAHTIKSARTQGAQAAFSLSSYCRWCLTGTPLQNNLEDLYSLLCFLHVEPWCNWAWWHKLIQRPYENGDQRGLKLIKAILRPLMLRRTKDTRDKHGRPILVLPPTDIQVIECDQSEAEHHFYNALFRRSKVQFDQFVAQGRVLNNYANILELLLRLRQCCNHPYLVMSQSDSQEYADLNKCRSDSHEYGDLNKLARRFLETNADSYTSSKKVPSRAYVEEVVEAIRRGENTECPICLESADDPVLTPCAHRLCRECLLSSWQTPATGPCPICRQLLNQTDLITCPSKPHYRIDVDNWEESSKVLKLMDCLERIRRSGSGEKSIVFSQWTSFLDLLEIPLQRRKIGFLRFDGKLAQKQREKVLKEFSESNGKMVMLMSLRAGGVGLNLTSASNVFLMDPWWNPAVEEQAIMRIHRIGQKRTVHVRRFIVKDTVEHRLQQVQARKQAMIAGALTDEEVRTARIEELKMLFR